MKQECPNPMCKYGPDQNCANPIHKEESPMFKPFRKKGITEMRPYVPGEDLTGVSVSEQDTPKEGDMIARNGANHADQWLVAKEYFDANYEPA